MTDTRPPGSASLFEARVLIPFVITALVWGSTWLVIKGQLGPVPASWSVTWRFTGGAIGMTALALIRRESLRVERAVLVQAALVGISLFCCNFQFVYRAEGYLTSGLVAVVFALLLVPNALMARFFLGQPITRGFLGGSAIALVGIGMLMLHEYRLAPAGSNVLLGAGMTVLALGSASVGNLLQATPTARRVSGIVLLAWAMIIGSLTDATLAWVLSGPPVFDLSPRYAFSVGYLSLIGSVMTFPLYAILLRELGPGRAAYNGVVVPVVAMLLSTLFEGYRWSLLSAAGAVFALAGLIVALRSRRPSR